MNNTYATFCQHQQFKRHNNSRFFTCETCNMNFYCNHDKYNAILSTAFGAINYKSYDECYYCNEILTNPTTHGWIGDNKSMYHH